MLQTQKWSPLGCVWKWGAYHHFKPFQKRTWSLTNRCWAPPLFSDTPNFSQSFWFTRNNQKSLTWPPSLRTAPCSLGLTQRIVIQLKLGVGLLSRMKLGIYRMKLGIQYSFPIQYLRWCWFLHRISSCRCLPVGKHTSLMEAKSCQCILQSMATLQQSHWLNLFSTWELIPTWRLICELEEVNTYELNFELLK